VSDNKTERRSNHLPPCFRWRWPYVLPKRCSGPQWPPALVCRERPSRTHHKHHSGRAIDQLGQRNTSSRCSKRRKAYFLPFLLRLFPWRPRALAEKRGGGREKKARRFILFSQQKPHCESPPARSRRIARILSQKKKEEGGGKSRRSTQKRVRLLSGISSPVRMTVTLLLLPFGVWEERKGGGCRPRLATRCRHWRLNLPRRPRQKVRGKGEGDVNFFLWRPATRFVAPSVQRERGKRRQIPCLLCHSGGGYSSLEREGGG